MIVRRASEERGFEDKGWLRTFHTFSFDTYYDSNHMGFRSLRVLNQDTLIPAKGFGSHSHKEMEIVTYVIDGALEHKDSMGNTSIIRPGEVQRMSAGTGVVHSEYNLSHQFPVHFFQLWFYPDQHGLTPGYAQRQFSSASKWGQWCLMVSANGREGSLRIYQDADMYSTILDKNDEVTFEALIDRFYWVQVVSGSFRILHTDLKEGDGASISEESLIPIKCLEAGELLLIDMA